MAKLKVILSLVIIWYSIIGFATLQSSLVVSNQDFERCKTHDDCQPGYCCASETMVLYPYPTQAIWHCKPLGSEGDLCDSLGNQHCPCEPSLTCRSGRGTWFFGTGQCEKRHKSTNE